MHGWVIRWLLSILALLLTAALIPAFELTWWGAIVGSIFLGIINAVIRPLLIILTLPLNVISLGLFTLVINGFMLWITSVTVKGFDIHGFGWAILSALIYSVLCFLISMLVDDRRFSW
ncbi:MAG TPA: phage holin family protein [Gelria sp.]|nr:phage holin family protein [Gelria sp.]